MYLRFDQRRYTAGSVALERQRFVQRCHCMAGLCSVTLDEFLESRTVQACDTSARDH